MAITLYLLLMVYVVTLCFLAWGFNKMDIHSSPPTTTFEKFTIVVVFRNENHHLPKLLKSLQKINYPKDAFDILLIDDGSTHKVDLSMDDLPISFIQNKRFSNSPKKDAITLAVQKANNEWLVVTDADCEVPNLWLSKLNDFIQTNKATQMVCGSVYITAKKSFLSHFQGWDFMSLQAVTVGSFGLKRPFMCNGANMAFTKTIFKQVDGYEGNNHIASGDDVFLLQKIAKDHPLKVNYLLDKNFKVKTQPVKNWKSLINQHIRWGSKAKAYASFWGKYLSIIVVIISWSFVTAFFIGNYYFFIAKILIDAMFLLYISKKATRKYKYLFFSLLFYPLFIIVVILKGIFIKPSWKG